MKNMFSAKTLINAKVPPLYSQDGAGDAAVVRVKLFSPYSNYTWYILEFYGEDQCFGWVEGPYPEYGYFSLTELANARRGSVPLVERDRYFVPTTIGAIRNHA